MNNLWMTHGVDYSSSTTGSTSFSKFFVRCKYVELCTLFSLFLSYDTRGFFFLYSPYWRTPSITVLVPDHPLTTNRSNHLSPHMSWILTTLLCLFSRLCCVLGFRRDPSPYCNLRPLIIPTVTTRSTIGVCPVAVIPTCHLHNFDCLESVMIFTSISSLFSLCRVGRLRDVTLSTTRRFWSSTILRSVSHHRSFGVSSTITSNLLLSRVTDIHVLR